MEIHPVRNVRNFVKRGILVIILMLYSGCARQKSNDGVEGEYEGSLIVDGLTRTYSVHVPPTYGSTPVPLIIALHGGGGSAQKMAHLTGFDAVADREGFIVVYPNGVENHWNDGRGVEKYTAHNKDIDDVHFLSVLIDTIVENYAIDEPRIYVTGISNGAMMSCRLACELSEKIAAIAMVAGAMSEPLYGTCLPRAPVSVLVMNGTEDPLVLWEGGEITFGRQNLGEILSVYDTVMYWVMQNGCSLSPVTVWVPDIEDDGCIVRKEVYGNGGKGTEVILYTIEGGGHTWPGGPQYASEWFIGRTCHDINGTEVIWQFFAEHNRK